ncbi:hypothetical protein QR98_0056950 [Sarcoptes scabiei]|uniref:Uncharacterized protein n=1 Tax=Sarcoptes scabiei TaxID=52283 RepID=A0A132A8B3_SARSC|nr:hypothetical protein QR98_0056950 [Sarcoptes scabiei]
MGFTSFAWGFLLESKGLRFVRNALNFLISLGCFLLSITTEEYSYLILPAIIILGLIGVPLRIANMQIADFFPTKRSTIISFYSGAFSSSPLVFVIIKSIYDRYEIGYFHSTIILFIISITLIPLNTIILPKRSVRNRERILLNRFEEYRYKQMALEFGSQNENPKKNCCDGGEEKCDPNAIGTNVCVTMKPFFITKKSLQKLTDQILEQENGNDEILLPENVGDRKKPIIVNFTELQKEKDRKNFKQTQQAERSVGKKILHSLFCLRRKKHAAADDDDGDGGNQLKVSLFSLSYLIHQIWFGWINTYMVLYSGSMSLWLDRITDDPSVRNYFARIFGIVQILALIIAPCAGYLMDKIVRRARDITDDDHRRLIQAQSGSLPILFTTLTLAGAVCCRFFDSNQAIYISIVFITILRALFIAVASAYLRIRYPASHFNRLNGIMCTVGAFFSLLQFPLFYVESNFRIGSIWVNGFSALMTLLCLLHPLSLRTESIQVYLIRREEHHARKIIKKKSQRKQNLVLNY